MHLHADNCSGQNKNRHFIQYLAWRVWLGFHEEITYSFMIAGHTKFLVDAHFGMIKKVTRRTFISSLYDIAECIDLSSKNNVAEFVGYETGEELIPRYKWDEFFEDIFIRLDGIKSYQHFRFTKAEPGIVYCRAACDSEEIRIKILKPKAKSPGSEMPERIVPTGLSQSRKNYLYNEIRDFCKPGSEDLAAPLF